MRILRVISWLFLILVYLFTSNLLSFWPTCWEIWKIWQNGSYSSDWQYNVLGYFYRLVTDVYLHVLIITAAVKKTVNVLLKLNYVNMTTSCESYKTALQQQIRASFTTVNSQWQRMLCNNVNCNTIPVSISCTSTTQADVEVLFNTLQ